MTKKKESRVLLHPQYIEMLGGFKKKLIINNKYLRCYSVSHLAYYLEVVAILEDEDKLKTFEFLIPHSYILGILSSQEGDINKILGFQKT